MGPSESRTWTWWTRTAPVRRRNTTRASRSEQGTRSLWRQTAKDEGVVRVGGPGPRQLEPGDELAPRSRTAATSSVTSKARRRTVCAIRVCPDVLTPVTTVAAVSAIEAGKRPRRAPARNSPVPGRWPCRQVRTCRAPRPRRCRARWCAITTVRSGPRRLACATERGCRVSLTTRSCGVDGCSPCRRASANVLTWRHDLCTTVAGVLFRTVQRPLRTWALTRGLGQARSDAIIVVQRFGGALNLNS